MSTRLYRIPSTPSAILHASRVIEAGLLLRSIKAGQRTATFMALSVINSGYTTTAVSTHKGNRTCYRRSKQRVSSCPPPLPNHRTSRTVVERGGLTSDPDQGGRQNLEYDERSKSSG